MKYPWLVAIAILPSVGATDSGRSHLNDFASSDLKIQAPAWLPANAQGIDLAARLRSNG